MSIGTERLLEGICDRFVDSKLAERQTFCSRFISNWVKLKADLSGLTVSGEVKLFMVILAKNKLVSLSPKCAGECGCAPNITSIVNAQIAEGASQFQENANDFAGVAVLSGANNCSRMLAEGRRSVHERN